MTNRSKSTGFTLIEIAIVLLVVTIMLGYTLAMFPVQQEIKQYRQTNNEMTALVEQIIAFAQVNGSLPCPDTSGDGLADMAAGDCVGWYGNVPAKTMGIDGHYDANGLLLDAWGTPYRYQVTSFDSGDAGTIGDFIDANELRATGIAALAAAAGLQVCNTNPATHTAAAPNDELVCDVGTDIVQDVAVVVLSLGKDKGNTVSDIQSENLDNGINDTVFVSAVRSDSAGAEFDDVVKWLSTNALFTKMIEADQLP